MLLCDVNQYLEVRIIAIKNCPSCHGGRQNCCLWPQNLSPPVSLIVLNLSQYILKLIYHPGRTFFPCQKAHLKILEL